MFSPTALCLCDSGHYHGFRQQERGKMETSTESGEDVGEASERDADHETYKHILIVAQPGITGDGQGSVGNDDASSEVGGQTGDGLTCLPGIGNADARAVRPTEHHSDISDGVAAGPRTMPEPVVCAACE